MCFSRRENQLETLFVNLLTQTVPLELPKESMRHEQQRPPETTVIAIDAQSQLFWNKTPVTENELEKRMQQFSAETPLEPMELYIDQNVPYARISMVLAAAQRSGVSKLGFVMESN